MHRPHLLLPALCLTALAAAEDAAAPIAISLPDLERSVARFRASPYGQAWHADALAGVRALLVERLEPVRRRLGADPVTTLLATDSIEARIVVADGDPRTRVHVRGADPALVAALGRSLDPAEPGTTVERPAYAATDAGLLLASPGATLTPLETTTSTADLALRWNAAAIIAALRTDARPYEQPQIDLLADFLVDGTAEMHLTDDGMRHRLSLPRQPAGLAPVDRTLLARLPADSLAVLAVGLDGDAWWQDHRDALLAVAAREMRASPEEAAQQLGAILAGFGIPGGLDGLFADIAGTAVLHLGAQGGLIPGLSLALPRSQGLDSMIQLGLGMAGMTAPAAGELRFLVLRGIGGGGETIAPGVVVGRDADHWWVSTDAVFLADYLDSTTGGWHTSAPGSLALEHAESRSAVIGATDAVALSRTLVPLAAFASSFLDQGRHSEAIAQAVLGLVRGARPETVIGTGDATGFSLTAEGTVSGLGFLGSGQAAVIAAIAIPNLLESRIEAGETAAAATLRSGIFAAQEMFRAAVHNDLDRDHRGEYGFLPQLAGSEGTFGRGRTDEHRLEAGQLELLGPQLGAPAAEIGGYRFRVFLPDGEGGALDYATARRRWEADETWPVDHSENYFIAYAWPAHPGETGRRVFAITQQGAVRWAPADAVDLPPAWNAMADGAEGDFRTITQSEAWRER